MGLLLLHPRNHLQLKCAHRPKRSKLLNFCANFCLNNHSKFYNLCILADENQVETGEGSVLSLWNIVSVLGQAKGPLLRSPKEAELEKITTQTTKIVQSDFKLVDQNLVCSHYW